MYVRDVVDGLIAAAERGADGAAYMLGAENRTLAQFLGDIEIAAGRRHRVFTLPRGLVTVMAVACEIAARAGLEPLFTREWIDLICIDWPLSSVGLAYFVGLGVAFGLCRGGVPSGVRWLVRASTIGSVVLIAVMFSGGYVCKYCMVVHGANLAFWFMLELAPQASSGSARQLAMLAGCFVVGLGALIGIEAGVQKRVESDAAAQQAQSIQHGAKFQG